MSKRGKGHSRPIVYLGLLCLLALLLFATSSLWMAWMGRFLVVEDAPAPADIIVQLAGDWKGERMQMAAKLLREKLAPKILVSGPKALYDTWESDLAVDWAVKQGMNREWFIPLHIEADSTVEETRILASWLREHGMKRIILVTSNFHTRRAGQIWRSQASDLDVRIVAAPCAQFDPDTWWKTRQGQKTFLAEWEKTIGRLVGL